MKCETKKSKTILGTKKKKKFLQIIFRHLFKVYMYVKRQTKIKEN